MVVKELDKFKRILFMMEEETSVEASMHGLQQKAGSWMDDFISAIKNPEFSFDRYLADYRQTAEVIESL